MNNLEVAKFLVEDAIEQSKLYHQYKADEENMDSDDFCKKYRMMPALSKVKDDIKIARRLLMEASKEL